MEVEEIPDNDQQPPSVREREKERLDKAAAKEVFMKLRKLCAAVEAKVSAIRYQPERRYWLFLDGAWRRRCHVAAREFKDDQEAVETFAPTSAFSAAKTAMLAYLTGGWTSGNQR